MKVGLYGPHLNTRVIHSSYTSMFTGDLPRFYYTFRHHSTSNGADEADKSGLQKRDDGGGGDL